MSIESRSWHREKLHEGERTSSIHRSGLYLVSEPRGRLRSATTYCTMDRVRASAAGRGEVKQSLRVAIAALSLVGIGAAALTFDESSN